MTTFRLLLRSLAFYWRTNLAVVLGVIAGTAVIGGALVVGDSVRGSLRQMTLDRLGQIDFALTSFRFVREDLANEIAARPEFAESFSAAAPALMLTGGVQFNLPKSQEGSPGNEAPHVLRAGQVGVWGVDERLWTLTRTTDVAPPEGNEIILNHRLAEQLGEGNGGRNIRPGDTVTLWIELPATIPREALLGKRSETTREIEFTVKAILEEAAGAGRLSLVPNQQLPRNAFVSLKTLQENLELSRIEPSRRNRTERPARVNAILVAGKETSTGSGTQAPQAAEKLERLLDDALQPDDLGMRVVANEKRQYLSLESEQQIVDDSLARAGNEAARQLGLKTSPVFVYLANTIWKGKLEDGHFSRYTVVAGVDLSNQPPFGPFDFVGAAPVLPIGEGAIESGGPGEVILNDWLAEDLEAKVGDTIRMEWHVVGSHGELPELGRDFIVKGIVQLAGAADDRGLTPEVKGITDVQTFSDWDAPFDMKPVTGRDDDYWEEHRATPKAFVSLKTAEHLWLSRYGKLTSLRMSAPDGMTLDEGAKRVTKTVLENLEPAETGLVFQPVKFAGLVAAGGSQDFSGLFIGFSFFLILSATILIGLLFRLGLERRAANIGLLEAVGLSPRQVRWAFLKEGLLLVVIGGLLGTAAAVGYASLMVYGLKTWWIGAIGTRFLEVYIRPESLAFGFAGSALIAFLALWWGLRQLRAISARELLAGATEASLSSADQQARGRRAARIAMGTTLIAVALLAGVLTGLIPDREAFGGFSWTIVCFFLVGACLLTASLMFLSAWLNNDRTLAVRGAGLVGLTRLGLRNAARQRQRSVLTVGLIASAAFVLVAVAAGHRNPAVEFPVKDSGNGGFLLVGESSAPVLYDFGTPEGREKLDITFDAKSNDAGERRSAELVDRMEVIPFRVKPGEDASCLNIYRTRLPTLLGTPQRMIERGGFKFVGADRPNPWTLLTESLPPEEGVPTYPALGDMNTLQYSLKKGVGSTIGVPDDEHPQYRLKIVGMFDSSVFQGVLLLSEADFLKVAPERVGAEYFLIGLSGEGAKNEGDDQRTSNAATSSNADALALREILESKLAPFGFDAERVADRLAGFLAVQNTYLSTFQTLGGLGLLLGTLGLATVMLRNVLERRSELALLRAVGFRNSRLAWLVMGENAFLLLWGLAAGAASALLAMFPHIRSVGGEVPWTSLSAILASVCVVGMLAALGAVREAVRTPIVETLRGE